MQQHRVRTRGLYAKGQGEVDRVGVALAINKNLRRWILGNANRQLLLLCALGVGALMENRKRKKGYFKEIFGRAAQISSFVHPGYHNNGLLV